ncbi:MAG TPA: copper chaperone PCu(A)C [Acetobacteraceae bacterium]|nr:copper chaperone PCu(A)C [Acetobacteraceae bacterium]
MPYRRLGIALLALLATTPAHAQLQTVSIADPWIRFITPQTPAAGYFTITNVGAHPVVITGASSPDCGSLMLHRSRNAGGTEHMDMVAKVTVPAHSAIRFEPGGYHLMCTSPSADLVPGRSVPVTLQFSDNRKMTKPFTVRGVNGK